MKRKTVKPITIKYYKQETLIINIYFKSKSPFTHFKAFPLLFIFNIMVLSVAALGDQTDTQQKWVENKSI